MICLHKWKTVYREGSHEVQECRKCSETRSTMYDMGTGDTYWIRGDWWSDSEKDVMIQC